MSQRCDELSLAITDVESALRLTFGCERLKYGAGRDLTMCSSITELFFEFVLSRDPDV